MNEPHLVRVGEPERHLPGVVARGRDVERAVVAHERLEAQPLNVLHDQVQDLPVLAQVVHADDVRVVEGARGAGLAEEPLAGDGVVLERPRIEYL